MIKIIKQFFIWLLRYIWNRKNGGISFFNFIDNINEKLRDKNFGKNLKRIYYMLIDCSNTMRKEKQVKIRDKIGRDYKINCSMIYLVNVRTWNGSHFWRV